MASYSGHNTPSSSSKFSLTSVPVQYGTQFVPSADSEIHDEHTLHVKCGPATHSQVRDMIHVALYEAKSKFGLDCNFLVNLVQKRTGESVGMAFVYLTNPKVYWMLLGKNEDGSERVYYIDDPTWVSPLEKGINVDDWMTIPEPDMEKGEDWATFSDRCFEYDRLVQEHKDSFVPKKVPIYEEPLIKMGGYLPDAYQKQWLRNKIIKDNEEDPLFDPSTIEIPSVVYPRIGRSVGRWPDAEYMPNIIKCGPVPLWITEDMIKIKFLPFATDSISAQDKYCNGVECKDNYPLVKFNARREAFVTFDPATFNALFAIQMLMKAQFTRKLPNGSEESALLLFTHSYRTTRDDHQKPSTSSSHNSKKGGKRPYVPHEVASTGVYQQSLAKTTPYTPKPTTPHNPHSPRATTASSSMAATSSTYIPPPVTGGSRTTSAYSKDREQTSRRGAASVPGSSVRREGTNNTNAKKTTTRGRGVGGFRGGRREETTYHNKFDVLDN